MWCDDSFLQLNVSKTKELMMDFHRDPRADMVSS